VIDLERFEPASTWPRWAQLVARRAGAPVLLLCPFDERALAAAADAASARPAMS
jgi:hypothetical protein